MKSTAGTNYTDRMETTWTFTRFWEEPKIEPHSSTIEIKKLWWKKRNDNVMESGDFVHWTYRTYIIPCHDALRRALTTKLRWRKHKLTPSKFVFEDDERSPPEFQRATDSEIRQGTVGHIEKYSKQESLQQTKLYTLDKFSRNMTKWKGLRSKIMPIRWTRARSLIVIVHLISSLTRAALLDELFIAN